MGEDRDHQRLLQAEERLFRALELPYRNRILELRDAPVARARVIESGSGPPLVLVHGAGVVGSFWAPLLPHLPGRRAICVDLPACGLSDPFDYRDVDLRQHARSFLSAVLDALDLDSVPLAANSLGATYALYLAAAEPSRLSGLVLFGATGLAMPGARGTPPLRAYSRPALGRVMSVMSRPAGPRMVRRIFASAAGKQAVRNVPDELFVVAAAATRLGDRMLRTLMPEIFGAGGWARSDLALTDDELRAADVPSLFVWGDHDTFQSPAAADRAVETMPDARLVVLPAGHHPWWDDPARCAALVAEHLGGRRV